MNTNRPTSRARFLIVGALTILALPLGVWALQMAIGQLMFACPDRMAMVDKLKGLDQAYFAELAKYAASDQCALHHSCAAPIFDRLDGIGHRRPIFERYREYARIKLSVCMDEGVILVFTDIGTPQAAILASTSEDAIRWDQTLLWSANATTATPAGER